jgi:hypothetical protein
MGESITIFREQLLKNIGRWEDELRAVQQSKNEVLHPYQRHAFDHIADTLRGFITEGKLVLGDIALLK